MPAAVAAPLLPLLFVHRRVFKVQGVVSLDYTWTRTLRVCLELEALNEAAHHVADCRRLPDQVARDTAVLKIVQFSRS